LQKVRLLVVQPRGLLRAVLMDALSRADEVSVEEVLESDAELFPALARTRPHFLIWGDGEPDIGGVVPRLFRRYPRLKVLAVIDDGRRGYLWELLPQRFALGELSGDLLVRTVREVLDE
jgi:DNA-binding NarL/FixJ family response regulator